MTSSVAAVGGDWTTRAACGNRDPEWWTTGHPQNPAAIAMCRQCPVWAECETADPEPHGVIRAGVAWADDATVAVTCPCGQTMPRRRTASQMCKTCDPPHNTHTGPKAQRRRAERGEVERHLPAIRHLAAQGCSNRSIADRLGLKPESVRAARHRHGIPTRPLGGLVDPDNVMRALDGALTVHDLTGAERTEAVRILAASNRLTNEEIALRLGWLDKHGQPARDAVQSWRVRHNIPGSKPPDPTRVSAATRGELSAADLTPAEKVAAVRALVGEGLRDRAIAVRLQWGADPGRAAAAVQVFRSSRGIPAAYVQGSTDRWADRASMAGAA